MYGFITEKSAMPLIGVADFLLCPKDFGTNYHAR